MASLMMTNLSSHFAASFLSTPDIYRIKSPMNISDNTSTTFNGSTTTGDPLVAQLIGLGAADKAVLKQISIAEMYLSTVVISFGIVCNVLTLLTLRDPDLKEPPYTYLSALALADLSALVLAVCKYLVEIFKDNDTCSSYAYCVWSAYFYYPLTNVAVTMTTYIMVVMTVERCLYVQFPFRVRTHFTNKQTRIKIVFVFLGSFIVNFPRFLWFKPTQLPQPGNVSSINSIDFYLYGTRFAVVVTWIHSAILHCLPLVLLIFLNAFLIYKFHQERCRSFQLGICRTIITIWDREQSRLTFTYIAIVGLFVVLIMPSAFAHENISTALFGANRHSLSIRTLQHVSNFLIWLDLSLNFALYAFINIKFKRAFKIMLRRWRERIRYLLCFCCCCCGLRKCAGSDSKRRTWREKNTFYMASHDEHVPFNNNKNRLENQQSNMSTNSKENSLTTVTFRLTDD